ncbi:MAG: helix-turn-helix domain-containing protein [Bacteriovoracia bacterium]
MSRRTKIITITRESKALKELRSMKGHSVRKVADLLGVSHTLVSHLEVGRANISEAYVKKFLKALEFSHEDWEVVLHEGKKSKSLTKRKIADDCFDLIQGLSAEKLKLLKSVLNNL